MWQRAFRGRVDTGAARAGHAPSGSQSAPASVAHIGRFGKITPPVTSGVHGVRGGASNG